MKSLALETIVRMLGVYTRSNAPCPKAVQAMAWQLGLFSLRTSVYKSVRAAGQRVLSAAKVRTNGDDSTSVLLLLLCKRELRLGGTNNGDVPTFFFPIVSKRSVFLLDQSLELYAINLVYV